MTRLRWACVVVACGVALAGCSASAPAADYSVAKDQPLTIRVADIAGAVAFGRPAHGTLTRSGDGTLRYQPQAGYTGRDTISVTTSDAVSLYTTDIPALGEFGGVTVQGSGYGSAWAPVPGSSGEFYGLTDRGPNVDGPGKNEKIVPVPDFTPQIGRFRLTGGRAALESTIKLSNPAGVAFTGAVDMAANTGETIKLLDGGVVPPNDHGLDPEGLVALPDGTFWISDEYGPFVVHVDATGREIERLSPFDGSLPTELSLRSPNQGMEGLTITPDGSTLVGIVQSALNTPGLTGSAKDVPFARIVTVDLATRATKEFVYPLQDPKQTKVAVSEITATGPTTFLVDERDGGLEPGANKKLWTIDVGGATDIGPRSAVPGARYDAGRGGLLVEDKPLETLVGPVRTADGLATLNRVGITPVTKSSDLDLGGLVTGLSADGAFFGHDKIEGVATTDGGKTLYISNDSDFGLAGSSGDHPPFGLKAKVLPDGAQDTGEILVVDTTKLPARTSTREITVEVS